MSDNVRAHQERESIMTKTSRFNYITRGLVGVCAATMLTGLCAGAAFAASDGVVGADNGTATSDITVTNNTQFSATVPTTLAFSLNADGTTSAPDNVKITNKSMTSAIHVSKMEISDNTLSLAASESAMTGNNAAYLTVNNVSFDKIAASGGYTVNNADFDVPAATSEAVAGEKALTFTAAFKSLTNAKGTPVAMTINWTFAMGSQA